MKRILITLFSVLPFICFSQSTTLYGLARGTNPAALYFSSLQPSTGIVTALSAALPDSMYSLNGFSAIDPVNGLYYYMGDRTKLRAFNISNGSPAASYNLNLPSGHFFEMMQYNCADSTIYALYRTSSPAEIKLCKFDPASNTITIISQNSIGSAFSINAFTTIDPVNGIYYMYTNTLTGISLATGNIVSAPNLIFPPNAQYIDMIVNHCDDGKIYCIARNVSPPELYLASVDPVTGIVSLISPTPVPSAGALNAGCEMNSLTNTFYTRGTNATWLGISALTGNPVSTPALTLPNNTSYFDLVGRNNCECNFSNPKGVSEISELQLFTVFPSPLASGQSLTVHFAEALRTNGKLILINSIGQQLTEIPLEKGETEKQISTANFAAGYYSVLFQTENGSFAKPVILY